MLDIRQGDSKIVLTELDEDSVDLMVTDPPYGLSFMGKNWDKALPDIEIWEQCLRVLKPGSFAFILCTPRQDCLSRMIISLEDAGFETNFTSIYWTYGSGFPKAMNISKAVDKKARRDYVEAAVNLGLIVPNNSMWDWTKGEHSPGDKWWNEFKTLLSPDDWMQIEREAIGKGTCGNPVEWYARGDSNPVRFKDRLEYDITAPATPQAKALDGSYAGFQPKPAVEPIIVVMKPLKERTYVDQALSNQKGITWLDDCRIPYESEDDNWGERNNAERSECEGIFNKSTCGLHEGFVLLSNTNGRFPANVLCCDDVLNDGNDRNGTGGLKPHRSPANTFTEEKNRPYFNYGDSGSFSRYFSLDSWWNEKVNNLPDEVKKTFPFLIVPKPTSEEKNDLSKKFYWFKGEQVTKPEYDTLKAEGESVSEGNIHPTVKPLALMSYLITLGSREGDVVLDPFLGSGTTLLACRLLIRKGIGIELSEEYAEIAKARINHVPPTLESFFT